MKDIPESIPHETLTEQLRTASVSDNFDLDAWIDGTCGMTRTAKIYQRGDLFAQMDQLERELAVAKKIPKEDRGVEDRAPEQVQAELDQITEQIGRSAITVHIQDRTDERRRQIREGLKKNGLKPETKEEDNDTLLLHVLADAIIRVEGADGKSKELPDGFPVEKLRALRDRLGDSALIEVWQTFHKVTSEAPNVAAPLSRPSSSNRGGIT